MSVHANSPVPPSGLGQVNWQVGKMAGHDSMEVVK